MNTHGLKALLSLLVFFGFSLPQAQALEHWYLPVENQLKTLKVENPSTHAQDLWISGPIDRPTDVPEIWYEIPANSQVDIALDEFQEFAWIHLKAKDQTPITLTIKDKNLKILELKPGNSDHWTKSAGPSLDRLILLNTSAVQQTISVKSKSAVKKYSVKGFEKIEISVQKYKSLDIQGEQKFTALAKSSTQWTYLNESTISQPLATVADADTAYFLFTDIQNTQSFVVKTDNADLKDQARNQIADPRKYPKKILLAGIATGHGNTNRDFFHNNKSPWSWHVSNVVTFADYASQDCDGSPEFVDEFINTWINSPGAICFWGYKVSKELTLEQIRQGSP